jgi:hypothetical protein
MTEFFKFDNHSIEQHTNATAAYLPEDETFLAKKIAGTNLRNLLVSFAQQFKNTEELLNLFINELDPNEANYLITEWESAVGIPDDCFTATGTLEERRRDVLVKLASLGIQTNEDFVALADIFGVDVQISSGSNFSLFFPANFPIQFIGSIETGRFTILVKFLTPSPLTGLVECLFAKLIPANCVLTVIP